MSLRIVVLHALGARQVREILLTLADGSTVADAIAAADAVTCAADLQRPVRHAEIGGGKAQSVVVGIWGRQTLHSQPLQDMDRVEIYRPLKVDPKVARRARFAAQGIKKAGLFAGRPATSKTGY